VFKRPAASVVEPKASRRRSSASGREAEEVADIAGEVADGIAEAVAGVDEEKAVEEGSPAVLKRPAAKGAPAPSDFAGEAPEPEPAQEELAEEPEAEDPEEALTRHEEETKAARRKELKATSIDELKKLVEAMGLEFGKKADMVDQLTNHEAAGRAEERAKQARIRQVVRDKKSELDVLSVPELKDRCTEQDIKGNMTKDARVETLIKLWLEDDGVEKALVKLARDERENELSAMDLNALEKLCNKAAIDPFVKEVIVDRIVKREHVAGRFDRPTLDVPKKAVAPTPAQGGDMVELLLAQEASRKREIELKKQAEEAAAQKVEKLKNSSVEELKKLLASKGRDTSGKKDDLVAALIRAGEEDEAASKRKGELKAMEVNELKKLLHSKALEVGSKKDDMVETFLSYEAKVCTEALAYSTKVGVILEDMQSSLEGKTQAELRHECTTKELAHGGNKEALMERLLESWRTDGEVDRLLAAKGRAARHQELQATELEPLLKLCSSLAIDPFVKEVMVERVLSHEDEAGSAVGEPASKRARKVR